MIIETRGAVGSSDSEDDDGAIPGPPPGSPKLYHTAEFIQKFASQEFSQTSSLTTAPIASATAATAAAPSS